MKDWTEKKLNLKNELNIKIKTQDCYKRTPKSMDWSRVLAFHQWFLKKQNNLFNFVHFPNNGTSNLIRSVVWYPNNGMEYLFHSAPLHFVPSIKTKPKGYNSNLNLKIIFNWNFLIYFCVFLGSLVLLVSHRSPALSFMLLNCQIFVVLQYFSNHIKFVVKKSFFSFQAFCTSLFFSFPPTFKLIFPWIPPSSIRCA